MRDVRMARNAAREMIRCPNTGIAWLVPSSLSSLCCEGCLGLALATIMVDFAIAVAVAVALVLTTSRGTCTVGRSNAEL